MPWWLEPITYEQLFCLTQERVLVVLSYNWTEELQFYIFSSRIRRLSYGQNLHSPRLNISTTTTTLVSKVFLVSFLQW